MLLLHQLPCYHAIYGRSKSNPIIWASLRKSARKIWPLASRLSRSLKVVGTNTDRSATYYFLLVIYSSLTMDLIRIVSEVNGDFGRKSQIFPTPCRLLKAPPPSAFQLEFVTLLELLGNVMPLTHCRKSLAICVFVIRYNASQRMWQTNGRTDRFANTICIACWRAIKFPEIMVLDAYGTFLVSIL